MTVQGGHKKSMTTAVRFYWTDELRLKLINFRLNSPRNWDGVETEVGVEKPKCESCLYRLYKGVKDKQDQFDLLRAEKNRLELLVSEGQPSISSSRCVAWTTDATIILLKYKIDHPDNWEEFKPVLNHKLVSSKQQFHGLQRVFPEHSIQEIIKIYLERKKNEEKELNSGEWTEEETFTLLKVMSQLRSQNMDAIVSKMKIRNKDQCSQQWKIISDGYNLHQKWTEDEVDRLKKYEQEFKNLDFMWIRVSVAIKTRSPRSCQDKSTQISTARRCKSWSDVENETLKMIMQQQDKDSSQVDWSLVSSRFEGKYPGDCKFQWYNHVNPKIIRGHWQPSEDEQLVKIKQSQQEVDWYQVSKIMVNRSPHQCQSRWVRVNPKWSTAEWSSENMEQLKNGIAKHGQNYFKIQQDFFPQQSTRKIRAKAMKLRTISARDELEKLDCRTVGPLVKEAIVLLGEDVGSSFESIVTFFKDTYTSINVDVIRPCIQRFLKSAIQNKQRPSVKKEIVNGVNLYTVIENRYRKKPDKKPDREKWPVDEVSKERLTKDIAYCVRKCQQYFDENQEKMTPDHRGPVHVINEKGIYWDENLKQLHCRQISQDDKVLSSVFAVPYAGEDETFQKWMVGYCRLVTSWMNLKQALINTRAGYGCGSVHIAYCQKSLHLNVSCFGDIFYCIEQVDETKDKEKPHQESPTNDTDSKTKNWNLKKLRDADQLTKEELTEKKQQANRNKKMKRKSRKLKNVSERVKFFVRYFAQDRQCLRLTFPYYQFSDECSLWIFTRMERAGLTLTQEGIDRRNKFYFSLLPFSVHT